MRVILAGQRLSVTSATITTRTRDLPLRRSFHSAWLTAAFLARADFPGSLAIARCLWDSPRSGTQRARNSHAI
jgi:hypothetical protein